MPKMTWRNYKSCGIWGDPSPHIGKNSQKCRFFCQPPKPDDHNDDKDNITCHIRNYAYLNHMVMMIQIMQHASTICSDNGMWGGGIEENGK